MIRFMRYCIFSMHEDDKATKCDLWQVRRFWVPLPTFYKGLTPTADKTWVFVLYCRTKGIACASLHLQAQGKCNCQMLSLASPSICDAAIKFRKDLVSVVDKDFDLLVTLENKE